MNLAVLGVAGKIYTVLSSKIINFSDLLIIEDIDTHG